MLLRSAIRDRRVSSSWAKVAALARKHHIPPAGTGKWISQCGGIDTIIRQGVGGNE
jgi:hypothetical protein